MLIPFMMRATENNTCPINTSILEARLPALLSRYRSTRKNTEADFRRNMDFLASEPVMSWDDDYINREMSDPGVENLKHLAATGVLKKGSPILCSAMKKEAEKTTRKRGLSRHILEQVWLLERSRSGKYTYFMGDRPPAFAFDVNMAKKMHQCCDPNQDKPEQLVAEEVCCVSISYSSKSQG